MNHLEKQSSDKCNSNLCMFFKKIGNGLAKQYEEHARRETQQIKKYKL